LIMTLRTRARNSASNEPDMVTSIVIPKTSAQPA
jgi:hypothetical protein